MIGCLMWKPTKFSMLLFNNYYYCYSFNDVIILLYNIFLECKNNDINVRKILFLLFISIFMKIYKHLKLLLFCVGIRYVHFIASYDRNNYMAKKQPPNLQTTIHEGRARSSQLVIGVIMYIIFYISNVININ